MNTENAQDCLRLSNAAFHHLAHEDFDLAEELFSRALEYSPSQLALVYGKAFAVLNLGDLDCARTLLGRMHELDAPEELVEKLSSHIQTKELLALRERCINKAVQIDDVLGIAKNSEIFEITASIDQVSGFLSYSQGSILYSLAAYGPATGEIVEIGSFMGRSSIWLARGSRFTGREKLTAIDPHTGSAEHQEGGEYANRMPESGSTFETFQKNIFDFQVEDWIEPLVTTSAEAVKSWCKPIRLLFIDGDHEYEAVRQDFLSWEPHLVKDAIIVFHDVYCNGSGPQRVVIEFIQSSPKFQDLALHQGMYIAQKIST